MPWEFDVDVSALCRWTEEKCYFQDQKSQYQIPLVLFDLRTLPEADMGDLLSFPVRKTDNVTAQGAVVEGRSATIFLFDGVQYSRQQEFEIPVSDNRHQETRT